MRFGHSLLVALGTIVIALPAHAGTPTLAGAPNPVSAYEMQKGVKVYRVMHTAQTTVEKGVTIHRLMQAPTYYSGDGHYDVRASFNNQIKTIKRRAERQRKKAFKKGYKEGYRDGYQTALENNRYRRPIRLRQRIRTRPRVSDRVLRRRNLQ
ncbi:MAG: hypothetical protein EX271_09305 [Acidimicrobiales bacterium]|nr:hypothetical protein [Hyphomonadaceae bacterium]RZV40852.1 MAG: hypothetical protein EX271_09305 [Acidimicrobiales bacterium]